MNLDTYLKQELKNAENKMYKIQELTDKEIKEYNKINKHKADDKNNYFKRIEFLNKDFNRNMGTIIFIKQLQTDLENKMILKR